MNIQAINAELAKIGYEAVPIRLAKDKLPRKRGWTPKTEAGRKCKARLAMWRKLPPFQGIKSFFVRNPMCFEGEWIDIKSPLSVVVQAVPRVPLVGKSAERTPRRTFGRAGLIAYLRDKIEGDILTYRQLDPAIRYAIANQ